MVDQLINGYRDGLVLLARVLLAALYISTGGKDHELLDDCLRHEVCEGALFIGGNIRARCSGLVN
ncbi:MAG: hypothetical protein JWM36_2698 [Hyphomicrobiales bacterium]|jgi:hypothetical protein|nr:hypothetical protein [Hyphomicrobiales bacterium]